MSLQEELSYPTLVCPAYVVQGEAFQLALYAQDKIGALATSQPLRLLSCDLILSQLVEVAAPGATHTHTHLLSHREFPTKGRSGDPCTITTNGTDLSALLSGPAIPSSCPPTFEVPNIKSSYSIRLQVRIIKGREEIVFGSGPVAVTLWPNETHSMAQAVRKKEFRLVNEL